MNNVLTALQLLDLLLGLSAKAIAEAQTLKALIDRANAEGRDLTATELAGIQARRRDAVAHFLEAAADAPVTGENCILPITRHQSHY